MNHLFFFCSSLCTDCLLLKGHPRLASTPEWGRHEKGGFNSGQVHRLFSVPKGLYSALSVPWSSKLKPSQVSAPHSPVCFEEKPAIENLCNAKLLLRSNTVVQSTEMQDESHPCSLLLTQTNPSSSSFKTVKSFERSTTYSNTHTHKEKMGPDPQHKLICDSLPCCCSQSHHSKGFPQQ